MAKSQSESSLPGTTLCSCPILWAGLINQATTVKKGRPRNLTEFAEGKKRMPGPGKNVTEM